MRWPDPPSPASSTFQLLVAVMAGLALVATACGGGPATDAGTSGGLSGSIDVDGSSTVGPLTGAVAEEYRSVQTGVTVNVGISGTGGGFEKFCAGETDINDASRPITEEEAATCQENGIEYLQVRVGTDALTMVTNPQTEFLDCLTKQEIQKLWAADPGVDNWNQVNSELPDAQIQIFAPDTDSGTYDFFTETILGEDAQPISDYNASADDNIIAQGVIGTQNSWGYFGFAFYQNNSQRLKAIAYDAGQGCVEPSVENVQNDSYKLARPLFIYVKRSALNDKSQVAHFVQFYLDTVDDVISQIGYIQAPDSTLEEARQKIQSAVSGRPTAGPSGG